MDYSYHFPFKDQELGMIRIPEDPNTGNFTIERYDIETQAWVEDFLMAEAFTGDLQVKQVSEEEAKKIIAGYKASDE